MNVFDAGGSIDSAKLIQYITTSFPGELKMLVEARDELAKRQGAMTAVAEALADRAAAAEELKRAKEQADIELTDAKKKNAASKAKTAEVDAREKALDAREAKADKDLSARESAAEALEAKLFAQQSAIDKQLADLEDQKNRLAAEESALQARIKAFQDKVAALSV